LFEGAVKYDIVFSDGEIGLVDGAVRIKDGTRVSMNGVPYICTNGALARPAP
jgi:hypothetical protein